MSNRASAWTADRKERELTVYETGRDVEGLVHTEQEAWNARETSSVNQQTQSEKGDSGGCAEWRGVGMGVGGRGLVWGRVLLL